MYLAASYVFGHEAQILTLYGKCCFCKCTLQMSALDNLVCVAGITFIMRSAVVDGREFSPSYRMAAVACCWPTVSSRGDARYATFFLSRRLQKAEFSRKRPQSSVSSWCKTCRERREEKCVCWTKTTMVSAYEDALHTAAKILCKVTGCLIAYDVFGIFVFT